MLTIEEVAGYLKLKPQTIYKWVQAGKIPGAKFGKEWRFRRSLIEEWIDQHLSSSVSPESSSSSPPGTDRGDSSKPEGKARRSGAGRSGPSKN
ncbi:MAG: helix-turn-helix domain-containing protein [Planctomycetota bacterium]|nr:helix-turn-helix domain-containing protein [Planctomycetota bacterium]